MTTVIELFDKVGKETICPKCGGICTEKIEFDEITLMQCEDCKEIVVIDNMTKDLKIKCKLCRLLHKRDCNSCTEHLARTDEMGLFEKIVWWFS